MSIYYWPYCNGFSTIFPFYTNTAVGFINKLSYSVIFIKKINLLHLHHWCFPGKFINFFRSNHQNCFMKKGVLKNFCNIHRKVAELQPYQEETPTRMFSSEYCKIFKNTISNRCFWFFKTATEQQWEAASVCTPFLSSANLLTGYEQSSP